MSSRHPHKKSNIRLHGQGVVTGITIGSLYLFKRIELDSASKNKFEIIDPAAELQRLEKSLMQSRIQLEKIKFDVQKTSGSQVAEIFNVHMSLLDEPHFSEDIKKTVENEKVNIEYVIANQILKIQKKFSALHDESLRMRFADIQDVYHRLLRNLLEIEHVRTNPLKKLARPVIFAAEDLIPSDIALLDPDKVNALVIEEGSAVSHITILAKSYNVPTVIKVRGLLHFARTNSPVIVNGDEGFIILNPSNKEIDAFKKSKSKAVTKYARASIKKRSYAPCATQDGITISLSANAGTIQEAKRAYQEGADSIGLFRSEFYYFSCTALPSIEQETAFYGGLLKAMKNRPVIVRTLDLGADKYLPYFPVLPEKNAQLGTRGIRLMLKNKHMFKSQLTSIVSARQFGDIRILFPFIATSEDIDACLTVLHEVLAENKIESSAIKTGFMVEIPSAALNIDALIQKADFVSIGTNDLVQYLFAVSREIPELENYRVYFHPVILKLIHQIVQAGRKHKKEISVCGEAASDPLCARLLIGLGIRSLSMQPVALAKIRRMIEQSDAAQLTHIADQCIACTSSNDVLSLIPSSFR